MPQNQVKYMLEKISKICKQSAEIGIQSAEFVQSAEIVSSSTWKLLYYSGEIAAEAPQNFYKSLQIREKCFFS